jgi:hypothetical protein
MISKAGLSETLTWRARAGQARRVASMLSPRDAALVEAYARECDTVPAQPLSKALGPICVDRSRSNVGTTEALGRQPKIGSQIKSHEHAAHSRIGYPHILILEGRYGRRKASA